jgi:PAB-dependent poly(A)-specific ribonuclease subunit 2
MSTEANTYPSNPTLLPTPPLASSTRPSSSSQGFPSVVSQVLGMDLKHTVTCLACGSRSSRASTVHTVDLVYPRKALSNESPTSTSFPNLLHSSIARDQTTKAVCSNCKQYAPLRNRRVLSSNAVLPTVLTINAALHVPEQFDEFWLEKPAWGAKRRPFLPRKFGVVRGGAGGGDLGGGEEEFRIEGEEPGRGKGWKEGTAVYELRVNLIIEPHPFIHSKR